MNVLVSAHEAASRGDLAEVKRMVEEDVRHVRRGDCSNWSLTGGRHPLVNAAENGHIKVVRYLLEKGSPIDHQGVRRGAQPCIGRPSTARPRWPPSF